MSRFISAMLKCLPEVRRNFYARGYELPMLYFEVIESMRERSQEEHDYHHYLDAVLREYAGMAHPWQSSLRADLGAEDRSEYLDMLAARGDSKNSSLDPNFDAFVQLDAEVWMDVLKKIRIQKQKESVLHASEFADVVALVPSAKSTVELLLQLAQQQGYRAKRKSKLRDTVLDLESGPDHAVRVTLRLVDLHALKKRGDVVVQYFFDDLPGKPFGLDSFVPGGYIYSEWNKNIEEILFSFLVQCVFVGELRDGILRYGFGGGSN